MLVSAFDVSKNTLERSSAGLTSRLANEPSAVNAVLATLEVGTVVAMEATGSYHRLLADTAYREGFTVYVLNPRRVSAYRKSEPVRAKTDRVDAQLLERYVKEKQDRLHPYSPASEACEALTTLVRRRAMLVESKVQVLASLADVPALAAQRVNLKKSFQEAIKEIDVQIGGVLEDNVSARLLLEVPGFGNIVVAGLLSLLDRFHFVSADAFIAYLGLDPRANDSGAKQGRRFISCQGDASVRRLLFTAALTGARMPAWKPYYLKQRSKGLSSTASLLILGRKMARAAWSIHKNQAPFLAERIDKRT